MPGFWSNLLSSLGRNRGSVVFTPRETYLSASEFGVWADMSSMSAAEMWASQPHFRTVVTFVARNVAQLGLHSFERADESDRVRDRDSVVAQALADVDGTMTTYELVFALVGDLALYDRAFWWVAPSSDMPSGWMIRRLPPTWVEPVKSDPWTVDHYKVHGGNGSMELPASSVLAFPGYDPSTMCGSSPTVDALRQTLQEQVEAARYRSQVWKRGGRVSSVIERPASPAAPQWSDAARESFREDWYSAYSGDGPRAGGTPILEDGMTLKRIDFNAQEQQFVEAAKLSLVTVASAFHVNPTMIGQNEGANYSNVREFRKMLYGDTLGPIMAQIEARLNTFLYPMMGVERRRFYTEFNIEEKLQGNFEEQTAALQSSTGAPWMTRNEARALRNLPAIEGGDDLVVPLNVLVGGQSSPRDGETAGGGGGTVDAVEAAPVEQQTVSGFTADEIVKLVGAAATLIRSGFDPEASLLAVGLDPVVHLGLLPITVQRPERAENPDEEIEDALKLADDVLSKAVLDGRVFKSGPTGSEVAKHAEVLAAFFRRQGAVVQSRIGAGGDWWDKDRWDGELTDDLLKLASMVSVEAASRALESQGLDPADYDVDGTLAFLREASRRNAEAINETTRSQVDAAIGDDDGSPVEDRAAQVFKTAVAARALHSAARLAGFSAGFGTVEAGKQSGAATKTWVTGPRPRDSHARMDGETVALDQDFSNGLAWPGASGDPDETAGCNCSMTINYPRR